MVGLFLSYEYLYDHIIDREAHASGNRYMILHIFLIAALNAMGLDTIRPNGAFYAFPSIRRTGLSSEEFAVRLLEEKGVAVVPGSAFGPCGEGFVRLSYATSMANLRLATSRMAEFVESSPRKGRVAKNRSTASS